MKKQHILGIVSLAVLLKGLVVLHAVELPGKSLEEFARKAHELRAKSVGYPLNQNTDLREFYEWYLKAEMYEINMNNVGNPQRPSALINTHQFENEVIDFFAPLYGFKPEEA